MIYPEIESINTESGSARVYIERAVIARMTDVNREMMRRATSASWELASASNVVLRGEKGGRTYKRASRNDFYQASAPGEAPAEKEGAFLESWTTMTPVMSSGQGTEITAGISSDLIVEGKSKDYVLGELLEKGTRRMAARPYKQQILDMAMPRIVAIFNRPY